MAKAVKYHRFLGACCGGGAPLKAPSLNPISQANALWGNQINNPLNTTECAPSSKPGALKCSTRSALPGSEDVLCSPKNGGLVGVLPVPGINLVCFCRHTWSHLSLIHSLIASRSRPCMSVGKLSSTPERPMVAADRTQAIASLQCGSKWS